MKRHRLMNTGADNRGMALLAVLAVISLLLVTALGLARKTGVSALASANASDRIVAHEQAISGIHLAMALLAEDASGTDIDSIQEDWASPEKLAAAVKAAGLDNSRLVLEIQDELGKLQINALIKKHPGRELNPDWLKVWENFFDPLTDDPVALTNCIQDWLDIRDDGAVTGISGAESDYYLSLEPPYTCANGPFTHISELFLVKGISPELFEGETDNEDAEEINPRDTITVHGLEEGKADARTYVFTAKVNINTAPLKVIEALLPREKADLANDMVAYRDELSQDGDAYINTLEKGWADQVIGFSKEEKEAFDRKVRYDSNLFRVTSQTTVNTVRQSVCALILRTKNNLSGTWSCSILQMTKEM